MRALTAQRGRNSAARNLLRSGSKRTRLRACMLAAATLISLAPAAAQETISYTYDARGRLIKVDHGSTGPNAGVTANYSYDAADNRTQVVVASGGSPVTFSISSNGAVTEGGTSIFTVTKTGTATGPLTVNYATVDGTAVAPGDYTAAVGTLTFATTDTSKTVNVATVDDALVEGTENFTMSLSNPSAGSTIGTGTATATINDNDLPPPPCTGVSFTVSSNGAVTEGANSVFTITKSGSATGSCGVNYGTASGTATAGSDYTTTSGTLTFTSTQTSQTVNVPTIDDSIVESAETFMMSLSSPTGGATLGTPSSATATINDNDSPPSFSISDASVTEGGVLDFIVSKAGTTSGTFSINYATANGSASAPGKYTATSGTLTFGPTVARQDVYVTTVATSLIEQTPKTMYVNLSGATGGATITDSQGVGTIYDQCSSMGAAQTTTSTSGSAAPSGAATPQSPIC